MTIANLMDVASLEEGYRDRGTDVAACDARRALAVEAFDMVTRQSFMCRVFGRC